MAITQAMCTSFKLEMFTGVHDFGTDVIRIALYTNLATLNADTTVYVAPSDPFAEVTSTHEVQTGEATGYEVGGQQLVASVTSSGTTAYVDFEDVTWNATFTVRGALIYNSSKGNKAITVLDFGADKTYAGTAMVITFPANTSSSAILRIV